jgi:DNA-binding XRE family transcriptional regulator
LIFTSFRQTGVGDIILHYEHPETERASSREECNRERIGVSQNTVSSIVNGNSFPKPALLVEIAKNLEVDLRELFISTKERDLSDPVEAIKEIKRIIDRVPT